MHVFDSIRDRLPVDSKPLFLQVEPRWQRRIKYKSRKRVLRGSPDYAFFYGNPKALETKTITIEAKAPILAGSAFIQLLTYMGE